MSQAALLWLYPATQLAFDFFLGVAFWRIDFQLLFGRQLMAGFVVMRWPAYDVRMIVAEIDRFRSILRSELLRLERQFGVASLGVFGSRIRGEGTPHSDLDILIRYSRKPGLIRFVELENELSDLLGVKVDLVLESALKPNIARQVMKEVVAV